MKNTQATQEQFLPENYILVEGKSDYIKLKQGKNKIRIVGNAIVGREDWKSIGLERKPVRTKKRQPDITTDNKAKEFRAFPVRDYADGNIKCMGITQASIKQNLYALHRNEDRGDIKDYDITIERTGEGMETKYTVTPSPKKAPTKEQIEAIQSVKIDMDVYFENGHPIQKLERIVTEASSDLPF